MAERENHEFQQLASRLSAAADGITNAAAASLERDLRSASAILTGMGRPVPVEILPKLASELSKIANTTNDDDTRFRLRRLLGEA